MLNFPGGRRPALYPIALVNLHGRTAVVVGGGRVGTRKARGLLAAGAAVTIVDPQPTAQVQAWADDGRAEWSARPFATEDVAGAFLVFAATDSRETNAAVTAAARARNILCNVADRPDDGDFYSSAVVREAGLVVGINSAAKAPARTKTWRQKIAGWLRTQTETTQQQEDQ